MQMISLYRDPESKSVTLRMKSKDIPGPSKTEDALDDCAKDHMIEKMQKKIRELESHLQSQMQRRQSTTYLLSDQDTKSVSTTSEQKGTSM